MLSFTYFMLSFIMLSDDYAECRGAIPVFPILREVQRERLAFLLSFSKLFLAEFFSFVYLLIPAIWGHNIQLKNTQQKDILQFETHKRTLRRMIPNRMTLSRKAFSRTTLSSATLSRMACCRMTLSRMTLSRMPL